METNIEWIDVNKQLPPVSKVSGNNTGYEIARSEKVLIYQPRKEPGEGGYGGLLEYIRIDTFHIWTHTPNGRFMNDDKDHPITHWAYFNLPID